MADLTTPGTPSVLPTRRRESPRLSKRSEPAITGRESYASSRPSSVRSNADDADRTELEHLTARRRISIILFGGSLFLLFATTVLFMLQVVLPNRHFMRRRQTQCLIVSATLSCWRHSRNVLSTSTTEQGRFTCWNFRIRLPFSNNSSDVDTDDDDNDQPHYYHTVTQYHPLLHFPEDLADCKNATACGMEVWPCQASISNPLVVRLHWYFPWLVTCFCIFVWTSITLFAIAVGRRFAGEEKKRRELIARAPLPPLNPGGAPPASFSHGGSWATHGGADRNNDNNTSYNLRRNVALHHLMETTPVVSMAAMAAEHGGDHAHTRAERRKDRKRRAQMMPTERNGAGTSSQQTARGSDCHAQALHNSSLYRVSLSPSTGNESNNA